MNHSKELEESEVVDNKNEVTKDVVIERRLKLVTTIKKTIKIKFHTFTLDDIRVLDRP